MRKSTLISTSVATLSALYIAQSFAVENQPQPLVMSVESEPVSSQTDLQNEPLQPDEQKQPTEQTTEEQPVVENNQDAPISEPVDQKPTQPQPEAEQPAAPVVEKPKPAEPVVVSSDLIEYKYGVIQLGMTQLAGTITDVQVLQGDTSYGRENTYAALIDATVQAQGTNFGNYSGATFTTDAFREAVGNAIAKF